MRYKLVIQSEFGIGGIIAAPPISVISLILWNRMVAHRSEVGASADLADLKERLAKITQTIEAMEEPHPPLITNSMERINKMIAEAEPVLSGESHPELSDPPVFKS